MTEDLIQGSVEWHAARLGSFGASMLGALMAKGEGKTRAALIEQLAAERLCGVSQGWEGNEATESGKEQEPFGLEAYAKKHGVFLERVGLRRHPALPFAHASPDALVGEDGGLELKSHVKFKTHLKAIRSGMSKAHVYQCQWGMACFDRAWWDYGHFSQEGQAKAPHLALFMFPRVKRDDKIIAELTVAIRDAEAEVQAMVAELSKGIA